MAGSRRSISFVCFGFLLTECWLTPHLRHPLPVSSYLHHSDPINTNQTDLTIMPPAQAGRRRSTNELGIPNPTATRAIRLTRYDQGGATLTRSLAGIHHAQAGGMGTKTTLSLSPPVPKIRKGGKSISTSKWLLSIFKRTTQTPRNSTPYHPMEECSAL